MKWFWSPTAIKAHLTFAAAGGLLTRFILASNRGPTGDYPLGLIFCGFGYLAVLILLGMKWRINGRSEF